MRATIAKWLRGVTNSTYSDHVAEEPPSEPDTSVEAPPNVRHGDGISDWPSPHLAPPTWDEMKFMVSVFVICVIFAAGFFLGRLP